MNEEKLSKKIEQNFISIGIKAKLIYVTFLYSLCRHIFRLKFKPGARIKSIFDHAHDIQVTMRLPFFVPFYKGNDVYLAVSEKAIKQNNSLMNMLKSRFFCENESPLLFALGYEMMGRMVFENLEDLPHILYGGPTQSGKSVAMTNLCLCLAVKNSPDEISIIIIDIGADTVDVFDELPHLACPIVKDTETALYVITSLVDEMERRQNEFSKEERMALPKIVCIIDEYPRLVDNMDNKNYQYLVSCVSRLLQTGRHAGIHLVISGQDPTVKSVGGTKLSNITARVAFACAKHQNSSTILGTSGAEELTEKGEMLYISSELSKPIRLQGAYMSESEVKELVERIKLAAANANKGFVIQELNEEDKSEKISEYLSTMHFEDDKEEKELADVIVWALINGTASELGIQKKFRMGNRAGKVLDRLFELGIISEKYFNQPREVLIKSFSEIPDQVMGILCKNGYTEEDIALIFNRKQQP